MDFHCQDRSLGNSEQKYAAELVVSIVRRQPIIVVQEGLFLFISPGYFCRLILTVSNYVEYLENKKRWFDRALF